VGVGSGDWFGLFFLPMNNIKNKPFRYPKNRGELCDRITRIIRRDRKRIRGLIELRRIIAGTKKLDLRGIEAIDYYLF